MNPKAPYAVLLDTTSIQKYIFQSNKLRTHLGGSQLVISAHEKFLHEAIKLSTSYSIGINIWQGENGNLLKDFEKYPVQIGYIGGGNALLFFKNEKTANDFLYTYTKLLMIHAPGLQIALAKTDNFDIDKFTDNMDRLLAQLKTNKYRHVPVVELPRHGITADCPQCGLSAEAWNGDVNETGYVSSGILAKINASREFRRNLDHVYEILLNNQFTFTSQLERLGQIKGEDNYIAVVHIDGNQMGDRFADTKSLKELRDLSVSLDKATKTAFWKLIEYLIKHYGDLMEDIGHPGVKKGQAPKELTESGLKILPICPIILGGDDVTFVCEGHLGIFLAQKYIEFFQKENVSDEKLLTACAGVAISKTKSRFHQTYYLAEELCARAKALSREQDDGPVSCIDFHIAARSMSGSLSTIREKHYSVPMGDLLFRPYILSDNLHQKKCFSLCLQKTLELSRWPRNKIHELGEVLNQSDLAVKEFIQNLKFRKLALPPIAEFPDYAERGFAYNQDTPYFDMIELMMFYPKSQLNKIKVT